MKITALAGGVGGAKLAQGLAEILSPDDLTIIVNTGDDFNLFGLNISPDLDTICYTLANKANTEAGWGIQEETFRILENISKLNGPTWFKLGDKDLATHLVRTQFLKEGLSLTAITKRFCETWNVKPKVLPMSDMPVRTILETVQKGIINFQEYFVKNKFQLTVKNIWFQGIDTALPSEEVKKAIIDSDAIIICPSNPFVSIDPILSLKGLREMITQKYVVAVSPLINRRALKGPLAKMFLDMGKKPSVNAIINHYKDFLNCLFIDTSDWREINAKVDETNASCIILKSTNIFLPDINSRIRLAGEIIEFLENRNRK